MLTAQQMPPSAFQNRKRGHGILFIPASHAEAIRRPATQRPRNTAFGPWRSKNGSPIASAARRCSWNGPGASNTRRPTLRPIANPTLSPRIAAVAASTISGTMSIRPSWASSAAVISAVSPGTGMPMVSTAIRAKTTE